MDTISSLNAGLKNRTLLMKDGKTVDVPGRLYADLFNVPEYLFHEVKIQLKLIRS